MPKITTIQNSFAAGQVSPLVGGRSDTEGYQNGVEEMLNLYPDSRGPAITRDGMDLVESIGIQGTVSIETFQGKSGLFLGLIITQEVSGGKIYLFNNNGLIQGAEFITNGQFTDGNNFWAVAQSGRGNVIFANNQAQIDPGNNSSYANIRQLITVTNSANVHTLAIRLESIVTFAIMIGTTPTNGDIVPFTVVTSNNYTLNFTPGVSTFYIVVEGNGGQSTNQVNVDSVSVYDLAFGAIVFTHPWNNVNNVRLVNDRKSDTIFMLDGSQPVQSLTYDESTSVFAFAPTVFISPPLEWNTQQQPSTGVIHEGKLYLATPSLQFWASVSDDSLDFTQDINAADSFTLTINDVGRIQWMVTGKSLVIGTSEKEFIITSTGGVVYAGDFSIQEQSNYGSSFIQPVRIGDLIIYASPDRRKLRSIQYVWQEDIFKSTDLTFFSEDLTFPLIKKIAWQRDPNNIMWVLLEDNTLISLVYERSNNVWGWSRHNSQGGFISIATGSNLVRTQLLAMKYNGKPDVFNLELTNPDIHMDSIMEEFRATATTVFSGFDEFLGTDLEDVHVFADGNYVGIKTVDGSGQITLAEPANTVQAGYAFNQKLTTLPVNYGAPSGRSEIWWKSFNKIFVKIFNSFIPLINGYRPPTRLPSTPMNASQGAVTELLEVTQLGYDYETRVTIEQDLPQKLTIIYIAGELDQEKL